MQIAGSGIGWKTIASKRFCASEAGFSQQTNRVVLTDIVKEVLPSYLIKGIEKVAYER